MERIPETEVAKIAKRLLKAAFPNVKFSVRTDKYSMGSSIDVKWTNGPTEAKVEAIVGHLKGSEFDSSIDLRSSNGQPYANDHIFCTRKVEETIFLKAAQKLAKEKYGLDVKAEWGAFETPYNGMWLSNIIFPELRARDF